MLFKLIHTNSKWDNYHGKEMTFHDQRHFDNWFTKAIKSGLNIIGVFDLESQIDHCPPVTNAQLLEIAKLEEKDNLQKIFHNPVNYQFSRTSEATKIQYVLSVNEIVTVQVSTARVITKWIDQKQAPIYSVKEIRQFLNIK